MQQKCLSDLGASTNRTQQLGGITHGGSAIAERGGELGCLAEVMLWVLRRLVDNACEHRELGLDLHGHYILVVCVT